MEPIYFSEESMKYENEPERVYCVGVNHKGVKCKYRAVHQDTQLCGLHHGNYIEGLLTPIKPLKLNGEVTTCFPMKEYTYTLRPQWMTPFK
tara:strand:+ start:667 stop:939 length:273 start_codon:yes stop_codon:yes gene_type:complete